MIDYIIDWAIVLASYIALIGVGLYSRKLMRGVSDYLVAGRGVRKFLGFAAGGAADMGVTGVIGGMEGMYRGGPALLFVGLIGLAWGIFVGKTGFVIHRYRETKIMTTPQLFEMRYSKGVRVLAGAICAFSGILNMGVFPIIAGRFFTYFAGMPETFSLFGIAWPTIAVLTAFLIGAAIAFAFMGGQVSVIVTDFLQACMISFMFIAIGICAYRVIQWDSISSGLLSHDKVDLLLNPFSKHGEFGLKFVIYVIIAKVFWTATWAPSSQKISSASSPREARIMMLLYNLRICSTAGVTYVGIATIAVMALPGFGFLGLADKLQTLDPSIRTQMIGTILLTKMLPVGIMGLMFAGMMAAFISTVDSYLLTWAGIIVQDVICPLRKKPLGRKQHLRLLRFVVILVGIFIYLFGIWYKPSEAIIIFQQLTGMIYGAGAGAIITYGLYWRRGNTAGAYAAMIVGAIVPIANKVLEVTYGAAYPFPGISGGLLAMGMAHAAYFLFTFLTKNPHFNLEKMLNRPPKSKK